MDKISRKVQDAYWAEWQQTQDHWLALAAAIPLIKQEEVARLRTVNAQMLAALKAIDNWWLADFPDGPEGDRTALGGLGRISDDTIDIWRTIQAAIAAAESMEAL